jgi:AcrR family transcriptional regulator
MSVNGREPLSRDRVIAAAIALVDEHGLADLSMRKLGKALGVEAMSLYNHVENKEDVLDGMLDAVLREVPVPDPALAWDDRLRALAHGFRSVGLRHPGVLPMFDSRRIQTADGFAAIACIHGILREAGFDGDRVVDAFLFVASFIGGYIGIDMGRITMTRTGRVTDYASWDPATHPTEVELGLGLIRRDWDTEFDRCITLLVDGLAALATRALPAAD